MGRQRAGRSVHDIEHVRPLKFGELIRPVVGAGFQTIPKQLVPQGENLTERPSSGER